MTGPRAGVGRAAALATVAGALAAVAGCGGTGSPGRVATTPAGSSLHAAPGAIAHRCGLLAASRAIPVLCPRRLPAGRWVVNHGTLRRGRCQYLLDLETRPFGSGPVFHALAGGRCGPWALAARDGDWPAHVPLAADLGLVGTRPLKPGETAADQRHVPLRVLRRAWVDGHRALVLAARPFPAGGVHGGHLAVVWNQGGNGYVLSMHPAQVARRVAPSLLLQAAAAMATAGPLG